MQFNLEQDMRERITFLEERVRKLEEENTKLRVERDLLERLFMQILNERPVYSIQPPYPTIPPAMTATTFRG